MADCKVCGNCDSTNLSWCGNDWMKCMGCDRRAHKEYFFAHGEIITKTLGICFTCSDDISTCSVCSKRYWNNVMFSSRGYKVCMNCRDEYNVNGKCMSCKTHTKLISKQFRLCHECFKELK